MTGGDGDGTGPSPARPLVPVADLTYKSIETAIRSGGLLQWSSTDGRSTRRLLYIGSGIVELIAQQPQPAGFSRIGLIRFLDRFAAGMSINVSFDPGNENAELKPLRETDAVWSVKVQKPKPGWRFLGGFAAFDCLVLVHAADRHALGADWNRHIEFCARGWAAAGLPSRRPLGHSMSDSLSEPYYEFK